MTVNIAYEVQVRRGDGWLIESAFDDEATAVDTAKRRGRMNGSALVRVVREAHDENTGQSSFKICYRNGAAIRPAAGAAPRPENARAAKALDQPTHRRRPRTRVRPRSTRTHLGIGTKLAFLLMIGMALFAGLQIGRFLS